MKKVDLYICSKPLQYLNICGIPSKNTNYKILIICDAFYKSSEFSENIRKFENQWNKVILVKGYNWFFYVLKYNVENLYYGLDSTIVGLAFFIKHFNFFLYEEGAGSYRKLHIQTKYRIIADLFGTGYVMGTSKYLKGIYVYYPDYYQKKINPLCPVLKFEMPYRSMIKKYSKQFLRLYNYDITNEEFLAIKDSKILLYITDWNIQKSTIEMMIQNISKFDYLFIKPHPHIKVETLPNISGIQLLYTTIIVEVIIDIWLQNGNSVTVYHQDSTAVTPFGNDIISVNVNESSNPEYRKILEDLTSLAN